MKRQLITSVTGSLGIDVPVFDHVSIDQDRICLAGYTAWGGQMINFDISFGVLACEGGRVIRTHSPRIKLNAGGNIPRLLDSWKSQIPVVDMGGLHGDLDLGENTRVENLSIKAGRINISGRMISSSRPSASPVPEIAKGNVPFDSRSPMTILSPFRPGLMPLQVSLPLTPRYSFDLGRFLEYRFLIPSRKRFHLIRLMVCVFCSSVSALATLRNGIRFTSRYRDARRVIV